MLKVNPSSVSNVNLNKKENPDNIETKSNQTNPANTDLGVLDSYKRDLVTFKGNIDEDDVKNPLDRFMFPEGISPCSSHRFCYYSWRPTCHTLARLRYNDGFWSQTPIKSETKIPWKLHVYADSEEDWQKITATVGRYLNTKPVTWKTLNSTHSVEDLNRDEKQKGKAFTIYPASKEQLKELASDIDYIIKLNHLEKEDTEIKGDRKLGDTGRIFYRYEFKTGEVKDRIFRYDNEEDEAAMDELYDPNRGENAYLAEDMTPEDDPFLDFNPSEK